MRFYDLVMVTKTSLSESEHKKLIDQVKSWMGDLKIKDTDEWGQKPLAYAIKKEIAGVYTKFVLEGEAAIPKDFETRLLRESSILRHLLLRTK